MKEKEMILQALEYCESVENLNKINSKFTGNKSLINSKIEQKILYYNNKIVTNINIIAVNDTPNV